MADQGVERERCEGEGRRDDQRSFSRRQFLVTAAGAGAYAAVASAYAPALISSARAAMPSEGMPILYSDDEVTVAWTSPWDKVYPARVPEGPEQTLVPVEAGAGEHDQFQLLVRPRMGWTDFRVTMSDLQGPTVIPADQVQIRRVGYVRVDAPSGPLGTDGYIPDLLESLPSWTLDADRTGVVWVTVHAPPGTPAGRYAGVMRLWRGSTPVTDISVQLRVREFALPAEPTVATFSQPRLPDLEEWDPAAADQDFVHYYDNLKRHRADGTLILTDIRVDDSPGEPLQLETEDYDRVAEYVHDELGFRYTRFPGLNHRDSWNPVILPHSKTFPYKFEPGAEWNGIPIFVSDDSAELTEEFATTFSAHAALVAQHLRERGWLDKCYVGLIDEVTTRDTLTVQKLAAVFDLIKSTDPGILIRLSAIPNPDLYPYVDRWIVHADSWRDDNREFVDHAREAGQELWIYHNSTALIDYKWVRIRALPWIMWKEGIKGSLSWWSLTAWQFSEDDPWGVAPPTWSLRGGLLLYPPRPPAASGHPLDSIRWELFRRGLEDYERFNLLTDAIDRGHRQLEESDSPELSSAIAEGEQVLQDARDLVYAIPSVVPTDAPYASNPARYADVIRRAADAIEEIRGYLMDSTR